MKEIGVVPLLYDELNYGGVLQFFALQYTLKKLGYETKIIYVNDNQNFMIEESKEVRIKKLIVHLLSPLMKIRYRLPAKRVERTLEFKRRYYSPVVDYENTGDMFDCYICGSDQIWNPNNARKRQFLNFAPSGTNKIIYAASLGCESLTEKQKDLFLQYTSDIQHISVREISGKKILEDCLGRKDIRLVIDPTLLLKAEEWADISSNCYEISDYALVYILGDLTDKTKCDTSKYAQQHNVKIVRIGYASAEKKDTNLYGDIEITDAGPAEFIGLIQNATAVFTDSFHACVFSSLFKKELFVYKRDGKTEMLDRIVTLFKSLDIPSRVIEQSIDDVEPLDYSNVERCQDELICDSIEFLIESIENV